MRHDRLTLVLESEAASIWYQSLKEYVAAGVRYVIVDIGGTVNY